MPPPTDSLWTRERLAGIVSAALAVVLVGVVLNYFRTPSPTPNHAPPGPGVTEFTIAPADGSSFTGTSPAFAISPDGRHIAFAASSKGVPMVWIRSLDTAALRSLPGTEGAAQPFWSPDSRSVGFFAGGQLKTVLVSGGSPAVLCDAVRRGSSGAPAGHGTGTTRLSSTLADPVRCRRSKPARIADMLCRPRLCQTVIRRITGRGFFPTVSTFSTWHGEAPRTNSAWDRWRRGPRPRSARSNPSNPTSCTRRTISFTFAAET